MRCQLPFLVVGLVAASVVGAARPVRGQTPQATQAVAAQTATTGVSPFQYRFESIEVPRATADEERRKQVSIRLAMDYLDQGTAAWNGSRKCVTCHTNGTYMSIRPALSTWAGPPDAAVREFFVESLRKLEALPREVQLAGTRPAQSIYVAAGLAEWDAHIHGKLSPETGQALELMFGLQQENGAWGSVTCWPPFESSAYQAATVAAMAAGTAPGWLQNLTDEKLRSSVDRLRRYLTTQTPRQDYDRSLLLRAAARLPGLIDAAEKQALVEMVLRHQRPDGGWSIRTFAEPEQWGRGNRAEKLLAEPEFADPPSDGHQTGLAIILLRESGVPADDARIQRGVNWLLSNQRASGRWWTRSLNTDKWHFITYSGTAYPVLALSLCNALPKEQ